MSGLNEAYRKAVLSACDELAEMISPTETWPAHAAVIITKHITPMFREILRERDETIKKLAEASTDHKFIPRDF